MSIETQLEELNHIKTNIFTSISNKGVSVPENVGLKDASGLIDDIELGTPIINGSALETLVNDYEIHKGIKCDRYSYHIDISNYGLYSQDIEFDIKYKNNYGGIFNAMYSTPPPIFQTEDDKNIGFWWYGDTSSIPFSLCNYDSVTTPAETFEIAYKKLEVNVKNSSGKVIDFENNETLWEVNDIPFTSCKVLRLYPFITRPNGDTYAEWQKSIFYEATVKKGDYILMHIVPAYKKSINMPGFLDLSTMIFYWARDCSFVDD